MSTRFLRRTVLPPFPPYKTQRNEARAGAPGTPEMALGDAGEKKEGDAATMLLISRAEIGHPIDASAWGDERRMKEELVTWAKAVAAMAIRSAQHLRREDSTLRRRSIPY